MSADSRALALPMSDAIDRLVRLALIVAPPMLRIALAVPFFRSGLTKWDGFLSLSPAAAYLFEDEFKLHLFGQAYDFPWPAVFAHLDGVAEMLLPVLLVAGLATRISALGPGLISLDHLVLSLGRKLEGADGQ
ncbi:DoxX family protein [Bradyrhizobium sp. HKCCYLRH3083]|uniref:DoxX family protein n=1 Tax=unclassified Bradyrhizobium TaxID=2631580 RepID=UPI003EBB224B